MVAVALAGVLSIGVANTANAFFHSSKVSCGSKKTTKEVINIIKSNKQPAGLATVNREIAETTSRIRKHAELASMSKTDRQAKMSDIEQNARLLCGEIYVDEYGISCDAGWRFTDARTEQEFKSLAGRHRELVEVFVDLPGLSYAVSLPDQSYESWSKARLNMYESVKEYLMESQARREHIAKGEFSLRQIVDSVIMCESTLDVTSPVKTTNKRIRYTVKPTTDGDPLIEINDTGDVYK